MFEAFGSECLGKPTLFCERLQLLLELLTQHHNEFVAQHQNTTRSSKRIVRIQPRIVFMLLIEDMYGAEVLHVILIVRFIGNYLRELYMIWVLD